MPQKNSTSREKLRDYPEIFEEILDAQCVFSVRHLDLPEISNKSLGYVLSYLEDEGVLEVWRDSSNKTTYRVKSDECVEEYRSELLS